MPELEIAAYLVMILALLLAGLVKGVIGGGMPSIAVPVMAAALDPKLATALTVIPVLVTNLWQAVEGGHLTAVLRRFWSLLAGLALGVATGAQILLTARPETMSLVIGIAVIALSPVPFVPPRMVLSARAERFGSPLAGFGLGVLGGATVMFAPVMVYLALMRLERDLYVAAVAMCALGCTVPLYLAVGWHGTLGPDVLIASAALFVPALAGMVVGMGLRKRVTRRGFQRVLCVAFLLIGMNLVRKALFA